MKDLITISTFIIVSIFITMIVFAPITVILYSEQFYMNSDGATATKGIFSHSTIELKNYTKLGTATSLFCSEDAVIYTRSINHESFKVCK